MVNNSTKFNIEQTMANSNIESLWIRIIVDG
jgi:hypothetical protein